MPEIFVYGTLKDSSVQKKVIGRVTKGVADSLAGYTKSTVKVYGKVYPIIEMSKGGQIKGVILSVNKGELEKIDWYETSTYRRVRVTTKARRRVWVYQK